MIGKSKLTMHIPPEIAGALSRRHHGRPDISAEEAREAYLKMQMYWNDYQNARSRLTYIEDIFWVEQRIEQRYGTPAFYGAHRRLRNAEKKVRDLHRNMFNLLVCTDGNYETFSPGWVITAEECYLDFIRKYKRYL